MDIFHDGLNKVLDKVASLNGALTLLDLPLNRKGIDVLSSVQELQRKSSNGGIIINSKEYIQDSYHILSNLDERTYRDTLHIEEYNGEKWIKKGDILPGSLSVLKNEFVQMCVSAGVELDMAKAEKTKTILTSSIDLLKTALKSIKQTLLYQSEAKPHTLSGELYAQHLPELTKLNLSQSDNGNDIFGNKRRKIESSPRDKPMLSAIKLFLGIGSGSRER